MSPIRLSNMRNWYETPRVQQDLSLDGKDGGSGIEDSAQPFEKVILSRRDLVYWPSILRNIWDRMERGEIRIVDVRRDADSIQIVMRHLCT
jgi:hypothetical protein